MTLIELVIWITITWIIMVIVIFFISSSIENLASSSLKTKSIDQFFTFRDTMNRIIKSWYNNFTLYWTWSRTVILLKNNFDTSWYLFWVIDYYDKKLQSQEIYWENVVAYRKVSQLELSDIDTNSGVIYDYDFLNDKILIDMRVKDFNVELYNAWSILDIYLSIVLRKDNYMFWESLTWAILDTKDIMEFNLNF